MTYEQLYYRRVIDKDTHEFIRDIDLKYDTPNSDYIDENGVTHARTNEVAIVAPACVGSNRVATFDENGEFVAWASEQGEHEPKEMKDE